MILLEALLSNVGAPGSMSQVSPPILFPPVVGRPVFRLVCSELNSRALLSTRYFVLINRKKMKQELAQKVYSWLGEGWGIGVQSGALWSREKASQHT